ncbi:MAG: MmgE/PrpD family protein [Acidimicrobiales bacterium]
METVATRLGAWASGLTAAAIPAPVLDRAKSCIIDTVGVSLAGMVEPTARLVRAHVTGEYASGPCTVLGATARFAATGAALANGTCAHVLDYDDTCYDGIVHASAVVWPAVLAAGEWAGASGEDALVAFIAGCEIEYALGRALQDVSYGKGWWNTTVLGAIGAASGAARVLGLGADRTTHALAIATAQAGGMRSVLGTPTKPYLCGRAAQTGVAAALCARDGLLGPAAAVEHRYGLTSLVNEEAFAAEALDALGHTYAVIEPGVAIKLFPVCSAAQAAMEAVLEIVNEHDLADDDVEHVHCDVTPLVDLSLAYDRPRTPTERQFSMQFAIGCILLFRDLRPEMLDGLPASDPRLYKALRKVSMTRSETLFASGQDKRDFPEGASVTVTTRDGRRISRRKGAATGMPTNPMSEQRLREKFHACASWTLSSGDVQSLLGRLAVLDRHGSIRSLMNGSGGQAS